MAFQVKLYQFYKKVNSTKQPTDSDPHITLDVELKDASNIMSPTLVLSGNFSGDTSPYIYRYCHIPRFNRYYFVKSWSWLLGRWECDLEVDLLATFKTSISNTHAYVLRSASEYNPDVVDSKYLTLKGVYTANTGLASGSHPWWNTNIYNAPITEGFYCVTIANHDVNAIGAVSHYAFSAAAMQEFMNIMYSSPTWMSVTDASLSNDLQKMLLNPIQYITNIMWIPVGIPSGALYAISSIPYGWWNITLQNNVAYRIDLNRLVLTRTYFFDLVNHPQYDADKRRWLNLSPYREILLRFEPFGTIRIDPSKLYDVGKLFCFVRIDVITGLAILEIAPTTSEEGSSSTLVKDTIYVTSAQLGVPMSIAQMSVDISKLGSMSTWAGGAALAASSDEGLQESVSESVQAVSEAVKSSAAPSFLRYLTDPEYRRSYSPEVRQAERSAVSNAVGSVIGTVKKAIPSIANAALAVSGVCESRGSGGAFSPLLVQPELIFYFQKIVPTDDAYYGIPLCRNVQLGNLRGFILCANGGDFVGAYSTEIEEQGVRALLESGFFYE